MTAAGWLTLAVLTAALVFAGAIGLVFARAFWRLEGEHASKCEGLAKAECAASRARLDLAWERARVADLRADLEEARCMLAEARAEQRRPAGVERIHPTDAEGRPVIH